MTGLINWFKTIFILEITGEIALKLVPPKYKEFIAFVMKLILVMAIIIPLLNIKNADISEITDGISNGFKTYSKENDNVSQALYNTSDKKMAEKIISEDINSTAAGQYTCKWSETFIAYFLCNNSPAFLILKCSFTSDMTTVSMINVYVKENNIAGNDNIDRLRADIADRYEISVEQIDIREAGVSG